MMVIPLWLLFSVLPMVTFFYLYLNGRDQKTRGLNIPAGSFGLPLLGEVLSFYVEHSAINLHPFIDSRVKKYGKIFKTSLFGQPFIVSTDAELNRFLLTNETRLLTTNWPKTIRKILGERAVVVQPSEVHRIHKSLIVSFLGVPMLRNRFFYESKGYIQDLLDSWKENTPFSIREDACKVAFDLMVKNIMSVDPNDDAVPILRNSFMKLMEGMISLPINLPWTAYGKAMRSRERILKFTRKVVEERQRQRKMGTDKIGDADFIGMALSSGQFSAEDMDDNLVGLHLGGFETTATAISMVVYFLALCPKAVQDLREEHVGVVRRKKEKGEINLNWEDYKQMEFTQIVIRETLRLGSVIPFVYREFAADVNYKGFDFPKGWKVLPVFSGVHLDADNYDDPLTFDPWRWQKLSKAEEKLENFMPFGQGIRRCAGLELAKMEVALFLHYLVLKYDWELAEPDPPVAVSFPKFHKGLPIKVRKIKYDE